MKINSSLSIFKIVILAGTILSAPLFSTAAHATDAPVYKTTPDNKSDQPEAGRLTILDENDYFVSHDDRHYTQGAEASYMFGSEHPNELHNCDWTGLAAPLFGGGNCKRKYDVMVGQALFTPQNLTTPNPVYKDRPYAAWLYGGMNVLSESQQKTHNTLDNSEVQVGVVGPMALGAVTQNTFHQFIGDSQSQGWKNEIHNEPGLVLSQERKWRFELPISGSFGADAIPEMGATIGNIYDYAEAGGIVRIGQNLRADYGPKRIRPNISGTSWFDRNQMDGNLGWYLFAGTQGRAVGRNIFLDGNTFRSSNYVNKKLLVADFVAGASLLWGEAVRVDFTITERTKEFYSQTGHPDRFGGVNLTVGF